VKAWENKLRGKKVLVTGHTGFTGAWLSLWLNELGANCYGYSLAPETTPNIFSEIKLDTIMHSHFGDINDYESLLAYFKKVQPDIVIHLAAQALVRRSYKEVRYTIMTNVMGTANVLEAARQCASVSSFVSITTDKVYINKERICPYREDDPLGGKDPYSASKAAAEIICESYRNKSVSTIPIATARGGNIIGGGDWSEDRLIPDAVRSKINDTPLLIRSPDAVRPWQHVLALIYGYLKLSVALLEDPDKFSTAWNLGPNSDGVWTVKNVLDKMNETWPLPKVNYESANLPEANLLSIDSTKANTLLGWKPPWSTELTIEKTASWYERFYSGESAFDITLSQIIEFGKALNE
jgi:CDP-glucose 4,6-dehydratase